MLQERRGVERQEEESVRFLQVARVQDDRRVDERAELSAELVERARRVVLPAIRNKMFSQVENSRNRDFQNPQNSRNQDFLKNEFSQDQMQSRAPEA